MNDRILSPRRVTVSVAIGTHLVDAGVAQVLAAGPRLHRGGGSFAAPEVEPDDSETRRKALPHALLSYFFGTVLIAVAINLVTNLGQG